MQTNAAPDSASPDSSSRRIVLLGFLIFGSYAILTILFWGTFLAGRGLPGETGFIELSQIRPGLQGFVYPYDLSRKFMSLSFHLAYLLSNGSYLSLHLIFGAAILLTGILAYLIVRRVTSAPRIFAYLVGVLAITFGADQGVNWSPYIVQRQTLVFALLAIWLLVAGFQRGFPWLLPLAAICQYFSLWTYEACLPALLAAPLLLYRRGVGKLRLAAYAAAWSVIPMCKLALLVYDNWVMRQQSYESRVLADRPTLPSLGHNALFYMARGLAFWEWPTKSYAAAFTCGADSLHKIALPVLAGVLVVILGALWIRRIEGPAALPGPRQSLRISLPGLFFMLLSYAIFVLLAVPSPLRTQIVSAVPAAVVLVAICAWLDAVLRTRGVVMVAAAALIAGCGLSAGMLQQLGLRHDSNGYEKIMRGIVAAVPCLKDDTMILLVRMPQRISYSICGNDTPFDPFRDVMWFNSGLQVLYPNTKLVGIYYRSDGTGSDSIRFKFAPDGATLDHAGIGLEGNHFDYAHIIAFRYDENQGAVLLDTFPEASVPGSSSAEDYHPRDRIACTVPPADVRHRLNW